jgi:hypothetical protein
LQIARKQRADSLAYQANCRSFLLVTRRRTAYVRCAASDCPFALVLISISATSFE